MFDRKLSIRTRCVFDPFSGDSATCVRLFLSVAYHTRELDGTSVDHAITTAFPVTSSRIGPLVILISCPACGGGAATA